MLDAFKLGHAGGGEVKAIEVTKNHGSKANPQGGANKVAAGKASAKHSGEFVFIVHDFKCINGASQNSEG